MYVPRIFFAWAKRPKSDDVSSITTSWTISIESVADVTQWIQFFCGDKIVATETPKPGP